MHLLSRGRFSSAPHERIGADSCVCVAFQSREKNRRANCIVSSTHLGMYVDNNDHDDGTDWQSSNRSQYNMLLICFGCRSRRNNRSSRRNLASGGTSSSSVDRSDAAWATFWLFTFGGRREILVYQLHSFSKGKKRACPLVILPKFTHRKTRYQGQFFLSVSEKRKKSSRWADEKIKRCARRHML